MQGKTKYPWGVQDIQHLVQEYEQGRIFLDEKRGVCVVESRTLSGTNMYLQTVYCIFE
jgi:hypothetical protein